MDEGDRRPAGDPRVPTSAQRAVAALRLLPEERERARLRMQAGATIPRSPHQAPDDGGTGQSLDAAGRRTGVSRDAVWRAERIGEQAPDVLVAMESGVVTTIADGQRLAGLRPELRARALELVQAGQTVQQALAAVGVTRDAPRTPRDKLVERQERLLAGVRRLPQGERGRCLEALHVLLEQAIDAHVRGLGPAAEDDTDLVVQQMLGDPDTAPKQYRGAYESMDIGTRVQAQAFGYFVPFRSTDVAAALGVPVRDVTLVLRRLGWPRHRGVLLPDGTTGPRWLPRIVDRHLVDDPRMANCWDDLNDDERLAAWDHHAHQVRHRAPEDRPRAGKRRRK